MLFLPVFWIVWFSGGSFNFYEYIEKVSAGGQHRCSLCGKEGTDRGNLRKHVENIHFPGTYSYPCKYCNETFTTRNQLNNHVSKIHTNKYVWLSEALYISGGFLYEYIIKDQISAMFSCSLCGKQSKDKGNLRKHVENIHFPGTLTYTCKYCSQTFTSRNHLNHHVSSKCSHVMRQWMRSVAILYLCG